MELVIQAGKLQKVLAGAKEIVGKSTEDVASLTHHVLLQYEPEKNILNFLAGDKELNHYTAVEIEEPAGERVSYVGEQTFLSIACTRLLDAVAGVAKETLVTIDGTQVYETPATLSQAQVTYPDTHIRIEASDGRGYALFKDQLKTINNVTSLTINQKVLRDMINSTVFCVSVKAAQHQSLNNLFLSLYSNYIETAGVDYMRMAVAKYQFPVNSTPYEFQGEVRVSETTPLVVSMSKKSALELQKFLSDDEDNITIVFYINENGQVKMISIDKYGENLIFNLVFSRPPDYNRLIPSIDSLKHDIVCSIPSLSEALKRSNKFGDIVALKGENNHLQLSSFVTNSNESFSTVIKVQQQSNDFALRVSGKHFSDILTPLMDVVKEGKETTVPEISLNYIPGTVPIFLVKELHNDQLDRTFILTPYTTIS